MSFFGVYRNRALFVPVLPDISTVENQVVPECAVPEMNAELEIVDGTGRERSKVTVCESAAGSIVTLSETVTTFKTRIYCASVGEGVPFAFNALLTRGL